MVVQRARNHHYVAQGYMRGFCETRNTLYIYDKGVRRMRTTSPKGVAYTPNFYIIDTVDEKNSDEVEKTLGKIESVAIPIINKVADHKSLTKSERADLAIYISIQYGRTPHSRGQFDQVASVIYTNEAKKVIAEMLNDSAKYEELMDYFKEERPDIEPPNREKLIEILLQKEPLYTVKIDNGTFVNSIFDKTEPVGNGLLSRKWVVYQAPSGSSFITSDNPIGLYVDRELGSHRVLAILLDGVERYFPLNSKSCLVILDEEYTQDITHKIISKTEVRRINKILFSQAEKYVISGNKTLLQSFT
jgi:hypothetical protein